ncbi:MAG: TadE family protein [Pseudomonadota bacterium]
MRDLAHRRSFLSDERGSATMEMVCWLPLFVELMLITADASQLYWMHGELWHVARDASRQAAIGTFDDADGSPVRADVEAYALLAVGSENYAARYAFTYDDNDLSGDYTSGDIGFHTVSVAGNEDTMSFFATIFAEDIAGIEASVTMVEQ